MGTQMKDAYLRALHPLNVRRVADATGRGLRTLHAYRRGERRITADAAGELVEYLRAISSDLTKAADALEAAIMQEVDDG